ncbi:putative nucleoside triphosphate pyrophosphatase Maf-like protein [Helianthus debilis subsp. tardiflorus]
MSIRREKAKDLVLALAEAKADAIVSRLGIQGHKKENAHPTLLLTADTVCSIHVSSFIVTLLRNKVRYKTHMKYHMMLAKTVIIYLKTICTQFVHQEYTHKT